MPAKSIAQNRQWVSVHYHKNLERSRALSHTSTAKRYMRELKASRIKSRHTSKLWYKKFSKVIRMRRRNPLAEPSPQVVNCLMTDLQDTFYKSKSIVKKILKGVRELPMWKVKGGKSQQHSACKHASSHLVRVCLQNRRQAAAIILRIKKEVMDITLDDIKDFGDRSHTVSREAYFYDAGYTHDHLPLTAYTHGKLTVEEPVHDLPNPIQVKPSGKCVLPDYKPLNPRKQENGEKKKRVTLTWGCTARCRQLSDSEIQSIVALKNLFSEDMAVLREGLDNVDICPYDKQEWEIPFKPKKADLPECEYIPQEKKGHPLVCHLLGSECKSPLRILRTAVVHFPLLGEFQRQVYTCLAQFKLIRDIDLGIQNNDY